MSESINKKNLKKTILFDFQKQNLNPRFIEFGQWYLPVYYKGIISEHLSVRENFGVFDVSHLGRIKIYGKHSQEFLQFFLTRDILSLTNSQGKYSFILNDNAGIEDDIVAVKIKDEEYLLIVNASNKDKILNLINKDKEKYNLTIEDITDETAMTSISGKKVLEIEKILNIKFSHIKRWHIEEQELNRQKALIFRGGYTGEDGIEIISDKDTAYYIWDILNKQNINFCGLGARDTLRIEAGLPLYGQELSSDINPFEAGFMWAVNFEKNFRGKEKLQEYIENQGKRKIYFFKQLEKGLCPRHNNKLYSDEKEVGFITSSGYCPNLKTNLGMVYLINSVNLNNDFTVQVRNKQIKIQISEKAFFNK